MDGTRTGSGQGGAGNPAIVVNGGFETFVGAPGDSDLSGAFGETMLAPGSTALTGWTISGGPITWRENIPSPAGGKVVELGPRDRPACLIQTIRTMPGRRYEISLFACTGRDGFHFNRQARVVAGDLDETFDCPVGSRYQRRNWTFRATSDATELKLCGVGDAGFGPMVDDIQVRMLPTP